MKELEKEEEFDKKEFFFGKLMVKNKKSSTNFLDYDYIQPKICQSINRAEIHMDVNVIDV